MTFAIHGIFEAIFRPGSVIIRRNRTTITPHYALPGLKIALKSPRSDKRQQTLVNNAGIVLARDFEEVGLEDWRNMVDVNMNSVFLGSKVCAPALRQAGHNSAGGSSIINISSVSGLVAAPNDPLYAMTKGGVTLFSKSTAIAFANKGDPIRVNAIHPGFVETEMGKQVIVAQGKRLGVDDVDQMRALAEQRHPMGRIGKTVDIANAALYLASDEAAFVTGSSLVVDGGLTAL